MVYKPLTEEEERTIRDLLLAGQSHNKVAKMTGRAQSTITNWAKREGIAPAHQVPPAAAEARRHHSLENKLEDTNELMEKVLEIAKGVTTGREMKEVSTAWGILTDKYLLLAGQPNSRSETRTSQERPRLNIEEEFAKWADPVLKENA